MAARCDLLDWYDMYCLVYYCVVISPLVCHCMLCQTDEGALFTTVDDDDFGLDSLMIFKSASTHLATNDCYYGHREASCNHITLHASVWY